MFSLIRSAHRTLKSMTGPLSIYRTSYELSRCVQCEAVDDINVDLNSVVSVPTCFERKTP